MRRKFFLLAQQVFVTNFLMLFTNFVTHIRNFVIRVTNFVINFSRMIGKICLLMAKTLRQGVKNFPVIVMACWEGNALCH